MSSLLTYGLGAPGAPLLLVYGLTGMGGGLFAFKVTGGAPTGPLTIRVTYSLIPLAFDPSSTDDALNPANYALTGPGGATIVAAAPVTGDPLAIDLYLGAPLGAGTWTIAAAATIEDTSGDPLVTPRSATFDVVVRPPSTGVAGGAVDEGLIRRHLNPVLDGPAWDALILAVEGDADHPWGDAYVSGVARGAYLQLFPATASGAFLDRRGAEVGVLRPEDVGIPDAAYRTLIDALSNRLLTDHAVHDVLEAFYGPDATRATLTTSVVEPFALQDGDDLQLLFGERRVVTVALQAGAFTRIVQATAVEVAASIDRAIRAAGVRGFAAATVDPETGAGRVRVYADARGVPSGLRVLGGRAQVALRFPVDVFPADALTPPYGTWVVAASPVEPGRLRYALAAPTAYDLSLLRAEDRVLVYGREFPASLQGTFDVRAVSVTYPGGVLTQWFEIDGTVTGSLTVAQVTSGSVVFLRSSLRSVHDADAPAYAVEVGDGLSVVLPATSAVVARGNGSAGYLASAEPLDVTAVDRGADGVATLTVGVAHGLAVGDLILVDGVAPGLTLPAVTAGSAAGSLGSSHLP